MNANDLLARLRELTPVATTSFKAKEIGLFGSFVRGDQGGDSDVDLLVEFQEGADLFDLIGLALYLEEELQRKVDVVSKRALREELREAVFQEVIAV
jgi:hypothetical protein